ncbi:MAG: RNA methyltransferase [Firmicutes bacterium]|nr:RNA methyltransferase [Bacillota bacterium]
MEIIKSRQNEKVKAVRALHNKKERVEFGMTFFEGFKLLNEYVRAVGTKHRLRQVFVTKKHFDSVVELFKETGVSASVELVHVSTDIMSYISLQASPDGVVCVIERPSEHKSQSDATPTGTFLVLDRISDPGNLGTIFRTSVAAGYEGIYLIGCTDPYSPKVFQAVMNVEAMMDVLRIYEIEASVLGEIKNALREFGRRHIRLVRADLVGTSVFDYKKDYEKYIYGIVVGSESHGISEEVCAFCDDVVTIPMKQVESLNAAIAAGILIFCFIN